MEKLLFKAGEPISHAYLIASPSPERRDGLALELAAAMLCRSGGDRPCRECESCRKVFARVHPDVTYIRRDTDDRGRAKREIQIAQVRAVISDAQVMPNEAERKAYIFLDADAMNVQSQNAMLKLLEEPPRSSAFILCAGSAELLLPTVRSRCALLRSAGDDGEDWETLALADGLLRAVSTGKRSELLSWCLANEGMDIRQAEALVRAARERLADVLCGRAEVALRPRQCAALEELLSKCAGYLRQNTGVKHVFGLIAADGITEE